MFPGSSVSTIVRAVDAIRANATVIGIIGSACSSGRRSALFGALESAFNIVYGRPNRPFFRSKALAAVLMIGLLVVLFAGRSWPCRSAMTSSRATRPALRGTASRVDAVARRLGRWRPSSSSSSPTTC